MRRTATTAAASCLPAAVLILTACAAPGPETQIFIDEDLRDGTGRFNDPQMRLLETSLPSTGVKATPHRAQQGVPMALVRNMAEQPTFADGRLNIYANEVGQGAIRRFEDRPPRFDHEKKVLFIEQITFADAARSGTNTVGIRIWVQQGDGANEHEKRLVLSSHFNTHAAGSRQLWPTLYHVHEGRERWTMPEGTISRRAGLFYRLAAEGRNEELHGERAVERGIYWDWAGLDWPRGWAPPIGQALYEAGEDRSAIAQRLGANVFHATAIFRRGPQRVDSTGDGEGDAWNTLVELIGPATAGRIALDGPLPERIDEVRLLLRSVPPENPDEWEAMAPGIDPQSPLLGIARVRIGITRPADFTLSGTVEAADYRRLREHFGREDGALMIHGDADGDGRVDIDDFFALITQWQGHLPAEPAPPAHWHVQVNRDSGEVRLIPDRPEAQLLGFDLQAEGGGAFNPEWVDHPWPDELCTATGERLSGGSLTPARGTQHLGLAVADPEELGNLRFRYITHLGGPVQEGHIMLLD